MGREAYGFAEPPFDVVRMSVYVLTSIGLQVNDFSTLPWNDCDGIITLIGDSRTLRLCNGEGSSSWRTSVRAQKSTELNTFLLQSICHRHEEITFLEQSLLIEDQDCTCCASPATYSRDHELIFPEEGIFL